MSFEKRKTQELCLEGLSKSNAPEKLMKKMAAGVPVSTGGGGRGREGHYGYRAGKPGRLSLNLGRGFWEIMLVDLSR